MSEQNKKGIKKKFMGGRPSDLEVFFENFSKIQISTMARNGQGASKYITKRQFKRFKKIFLCLRAILKMLKNPRKIKDFNGLHILRVKTEIHGFFMTQMALYVLKLSKID